jgi:hypothetical protein
MIPFFFARFATCCRLRPPSLLNFFLHALAGSSSKAWMAIQKLIVAYVSAS